MTDMQTVGLYSYPRSGSNWVRLTLYSLLIDNQPFTNADVERDIPSHPDGDALSGPLFDTVAGPFKVFKTHALNIVDQHHGQLTNTKFYFYVYRHPLDVFCSYVNYLHVYRENLQWAFELPLVSFAEHVQTGTIEDFFSQFMVTGSVSAGIDGAGSWWQSMAYWRMMKEQYSNYIHLMRYEDLVADPVGNFAGMAAFFQKTQSQLAEALHNVATCYDKDGAFFWQMRSGYYRDLLPPHLVERFNVRFGDRLAAYGYPA